MASVATFIESYPAFQDTDPSLVGGQLDLALALLSADAWGSYLDKAVYLDMAHNLALMGVAAMPNGAFQAAIGPVNSISGAGISTSFESFRVNEKSYREQWYSKTVYGQQLLRLWNMVCDSCVLAS